MRQLHLDIVKTFAMWAVMVSHVVFWIHPTDAVTDSIIQVLYALHLPSFMVVSGMFMYKSQQLSPLEFLRRRSVQLLLPVLSFDLLYLAIYVGLGMPLFDYPAPDVVYVFTEWRMWFLKYLFAALVIAYFSRRFIHNDLFAALLPTLLLVYCFRVGVFRVLPFLWVGFFVHKYCAWIYRHRVWVISLSAIVFALCLPFFRPEFNAPVRVLSWREGGLQCDPSGFFITTLYAVIGTAGSLFLIATLQWLCERFSHWRLWALLAAPGSNTLGIYCLQILLLEPLAGHIPYISGPWQSAAMLLIALVYLIVLHHLVRLMRRNKWISFFFLGVQPKKK